MNAKRWIALVIALGIFGVSIIVSISMSFFESVKGAQTDLTSLTDESQEKTLENGSPSSKIAVLEVSGTIQDNGDSSSLLGADGYNHRTFLKNLERAKDDKTVKGIVLKVNSPGGGVYESAEIHKKLEEIKKETKKPIYVSMGSMAASGGYYISTAADKIFATPETLTGSLGVIMESVNYSKLAYLDTDKHGELEVKRDTAPIGVFTSEGYITEIETPDGKKEVLAADAILWSSRFKDACELLLEWYGRGININTSCEILYSNYTVQDGIEHLQSPIYFEGHAILNSEKRGEHDIVLPAYDSSKLLS